MRFSISASDMTSALVGRILRAIFLLRAIGSRSTATRAKQVCELQDLHGRTHGAGLELRQIEDRAEELLDRRQRMVDLRDEPLLLWRLT